MEVGSLNKTQLAAKRSDSPVTSHLSELLLCCEIKKKNNFSLTWIILPGEKASLGYNSQCQKGKMLI